VIVVDTSSLVAVAAGEAGWMNHLRVIHAAGRCFISPINYVEVGIVLITRNFLTSSIDVDPWLASLKIEVRTDIPLAERALGAYLTYGKGVHPARLNLADTFSYALASILDLPLLYKGDDFSRTDIRSALQPT
jgi:ribonuclease VapC